MKRRIWKREDDEFLIKNYKSLGKEKIVYSLKKTWSSIQSRASRLKIKRIYVSHRNGTQKIWTQQEIEYLKKNYEELDSTIIVEQLNRTWSSIQQKAFSLHLKRENKALSNQFNLINGSNESLYWIGFCMADGHFNEKNKQLQINLAKKDFRHLEKFAEFMDYKKKLNKPSLNIGIGEIWNSLYNKFKINHQKTLFPCDLSNLTYEELIPITIGFIDGDGSIDKKGYIKVKGHKVWENNIKKMLSTFTGKFNKEYTPYYDGNLVSCHITDIEITKYIKKIAVEMDLPILDRKWSRISFDKLSKKERSTKKIEICKFYYNQGCSNKQISLNTGLSISFIYKAIKIINSCNKK